jgi:hypothetical protein
MERTTLASSVDPIIAAWQTEQHKIGMIEFFPLDTVAARFPFCKLPSDATFLGVMEADALCLMDGGALRVYDHEVADRIFCLAALNQSKLIEALKVLEEYFEKCGEDDDYCEDETAGVTVRERCTAIAGGEEYESFFGSLVGF